MQTATDTAPGWFAYVKLALLAAIGLLLGWLVVRTSLAAFFAERRPAVALALNATEPAALLKMAQRELDVHFAGGAVAPLARARIQPGAADPAAASSKTFSRLSAWAKAADAAVDSTVGQTEADAPADDEAGGQESAAAGTGPAPPSTPAAPAGPAAERLQAPVTLTPEAAAAAGRIRSYAEAALKANPVNARALRILGQVASSTGDDATAERYMEAAANASLRESIAHYWLMRRNFETRRFERAATLADSILRTRPQLMDAVVLTLAQMAENETAAKALKRILVPKPPWRARFFDLLPGASRDARTPLKVLQDLKTTAHPPVSGELRWYLNFLLQRKLYDLAYDTWLQFLPDDQLGTAGFLFNGQFAFPPSGLAFDWSIVAKSGVTADLEPLPEGGTKRGLVIEFRSGQVDFPGVSQTLVVKPGSYVFKGRYKGTIIGRRGLKWHVRCLGDTPSQIAESEMFVGVTQNWTNFQIPFEVAAQSCPAQFVHLDLDARSASERLVSGTMWFADLEIARAETAPPSAPTK